MDIHQFYASFDCLQAYIYIHLIKMKTTASVHEIGQHVQHTADIEYYSNTLEDKHNEMPKLCQQVKNKLDELNVLVTVFQSVDGLKAVSKHVTSAIMILKAVPTIPELRSDTLLEKRNIPSNKNSEIQSRFFSTKRNKVIKSLQLKS